MDSLDFIKEVQKGKINPVKNIKNLFPKLKEINKEYHFFNTLEEQQAIQQAKSINKKGKLAGLPISIKDDIAVKGMESTCTSKILKNYIPVYDATIIELLKAEGAIIIGKTSNDAFGFGSFNTNVGIDYKVPKNPINKLHSCGGSSGGSAGITKLADFPHISIGESTGGSIACPASFCGVTGFTPTYSRVSRYGLIDYASSLDKIGPITKSVEESALILNTICKFDPKDSTSSNQPQENFLKSLKKSKPKIAIIKDTLIEPTDQKIINLFNNKISNLEKENIKYKEITLPLTKKYALETYYILAMSEASTNLAKYCGIRYGKHEPLKGNFNEYFSYVRSKNLNQESKRRIMLGTFARMSGYRDAFYLKASKIRTKIIEEYKKQFKKFDLILSPTMPITSPKFEDIKKLTPLQNYMMDTITVGPNLAGLPHLSINMGKINNLPSGMMIIGDHFQEQKILNLAKVIQDGI